MGRLEVGISGLSEIMEKALQVMESPDESIKAILLSELKARNCVPSSASEQYVKALWTVFKKVHNQRREQLEMSYKGISREKIPWFPTVDESGCSGCSSCVEFCTQGVFSFDGKSHVVKPYNFIVGNSSCRSFCPEKAIVFPTTSELREKVAQLRDRCGVRS